MPQYKFTGVREARARWQCDGLVGAVPLRTFEVALSQAESCEILLRRQKQMDARAFVYGTLLASGWRCVDMYTLSHGR